MNSIRVLITGANGMIGHALIKLLLKETTVTIIAIGRSKDRNAVTQEDRYIYHTIDITDGVTASAFYQQQQPDIIIHCAAVANVDECELDKVNCWNVNVTATRFLVDAAKKFNPHLIFLSTDFVFDGLNGPYSEDDIAGPVNYYGSSKVAAEKAIIESNLPAAIVRTCLVYADMNDDAKETILKKVKNSLSQNKTIAVVADQWRTPTYVDDLAKGILLLVKKRLNGIFNISGNEMLSLYDMAVQTAERFGLNSSLIEKVNSSNFSQAAVRPARTGFVIDKAKTLLGYEPTSFATALKNMS